MDDYRKELFEFLFSGLLNVLFVALVALLLWPLGSVVLALRLSKGYVVLWIVTWIATALLYRAQQLFRVDMYERANAYVFSNLTVSCLLQMGWSAFAALGVQGFVGGVGVWTAVAVYGAGLLSCLVAFYVVSAFYYGEVYRFLSLPLALASFVVFSVWPASGRVLYGWFFDIF